MAAGKDTLKKIHEQTTVDQVLELMDAIQEEHEVELEISEILHNAVPQMSVTDEAAVEDELAALQAELDTADAVDSTPQLLPILPVARQTSRYSNTSHGKRHCNPQTRTSGRSRLNDHMHNYFQALEVLFVVCGTAG